jgi:hypothetical protein
VAVAFEPRFSDERGLWFVDVELDAGTAYFPFVRLALARYQEHALPGLELSSVVQTDFVQLTASRTATVVRDGSVAVVTLVGPSAVNAFGLGHRVAVTLQTRPPLGSELLWRDEGSVEAGAPSMRGDGVATWAARIALPLLDDGREVQLLVVEHEVYATELADGGVGEATRIVYADAFRIEPA